jgi:hypothetical protein
MRPGCLWNAQGDLICSKVSNKASSNPSFIIEGFKSGPRRIVTKQITNSQLDSNKSLMIPQKKTIIECDPMKPHKESKCAPYGDTVSCDTTFVIDGENLVSIPACVVPYGSY